MNHDSDTLTTKLNNINYNNNNNSNYQSEFLNFAQNPLLLNNRIQSNNGIGQSNINLAGNDLGSSNIYYYNNGINNQTPSSNKIINNSNHSLPQNSLVPTNNGLGLTLNQNISASNQNSSLNNNISNNNINNTNNSISFLGNNFSNNFSSSYPQIPILSRNNSITNYMTENNGNYNPFGYNQNNEHYMSSWQDENNGFFLAKNHEVSLTPLI